MFEKGFTRIQKVVTQFDKLVSEVEKGVAEVEETIRTNDTAVEQAKEKFDLFKAKTDRDNGILATSLDQGREIAKNINRLIGK